MGYALKSDPTVGGNSHGARYGKHGDAWISISDLVPTGIVDGDA